ncbi:Inositol phosphoceramide mannosyltransferase 3 [Ceratocystis lukuohia]|uniref:Inositol phosphoceramide mannosyltransferase 3 n=1 Tax=Ceratocystis lukuohia TaxID=2019550 RepID=A0ABR4MU73_9PEZI
MRPVTKSSRRLLVLALVLVSITPFHGFIFITSTTQAIQKWSTIIPGEIYTKDNSYVDNALEVRLAPEIKASEMMARPIATRLGTIPKIFHQSWIDSNLPAKFQHVYADLDIDCLRSSNVIFENYSAPYDTAAHVIVGEDESPDRMAFLGRMGTDEQFEHSIPNAWMASTPGHPFFLLPLESVLKRFSREKQWTDLPEDVTGPVALRRAILKYQKHYIWEKSPEALENDMERYISAGSYKMRPDLKHTVQLLHHDVIYPLQMGAR